jgi:N-acetylglucosaminyldiphosphoundecaprenol N-acetyl-beta-D-mannosaminyltransferase
MVGRKGLEGGQVLRLFRKIQACFKDMGNSNVYIVDTGGDAELPDGYRRQQKTGVTGAQPSMPSAGALAAVIIERFLEIIVAIALLLAAVMPIAASLGLRRLFAGKPVYVTRVIRGRGGKALKVFRFSVGPETIRALPLLIELLKGGIALVGTEITDFQECDSNSEQAELDTVRPGVVSLWNLRRSSRIAHEGKLAIELEYVRNKCLVYDLLLLFRYLPVMFYREKAAEDSSSLSLLGLDVANFTMKEAISVIRKHLREARQCSIFFVNPDCCNKMCEDREYCRVLSRADYVFPDGIGLVIAGKMLETPMKENINGTDMFPYLCRMARQEGRSMFLLGGKPGVAETMAEKIRETYGVTVAGTAHGYFDQEWGSDAVITRINESGADILLVAFGAPLQEKWITSHRAQLKPFILLGVGGLFDFYSGRIRRAPVWIREIGLEWVFRILMEPGRMWKRYVIGNPLFLYRVMSWKYFTKAAGSMYNKFDIAVRKRLMKSVGESINPKGRYGRAMKIAAWDATIRYASLLKRLLDVVISLAAIIALSPVFIITAAAIWIEDPGPVFFSQARVGRNGRHFRFFKFRSMVIDAERLKQQLAGQNESADGVIFKMKRDPRITKVGRVIRKTSIDELPQLFNVLLGDMSLVGPRPPLPAEVAGYTLEQRKRLHVMPGITCLWQVNGRSDIPFNEQYMLDLEYIRSSSILNDIWLLLKTVPAVLTGKGAY